jgi:hypothetical protein
LSNDKNFMDLTNNDTYISSCLKFVKNSLSNYKDIGKIKESQEEINAYDNLKFIEPPSNVFIMDKIKENEILRAKKCIIEGKFFSEHTAAGEATRLGLGTKYLINISKDLSDTKIAKLISEEKKIHVSDEEIINESGCKSNELLNLSLGSRHMIQFSFDIYQVAKEMNVNPYDTLQKQKMLIILNETTCEKIIAEFVKYNYFGFSRENVYFMVQNSYHGFNHTNDGFEYDKESPKRLHNHGQMVMQQTMDDQIFNIDTNGSKIYFKAVDFGEILKGMDDKQSFNIEDLGFLTSAIDYESLALALSKSDEGFRMVMEIVANNPSNPQKGGMATFDKKLQRNVMIEAFQLKGIKNSDIKFLNKNFNHYPKPYESWIELKKKGLNMSIDIKNEYVYFQPVQGDINFLVKTEFVQRKILKPILAWKTSATTPLTIKCMRKQDLQDGFLDYVKKMMKVEI